MIETQIAREALLRLQANIEKVIHGKTEVVRNAIVGLLAQGHILFEDIPGVGKTTLAHCLAGSLGLSFNRIQFTSDMLPSDILGVTVYDPDKHDFEFRPGPIFANVVLVDEINRTTPKTQSALLQAMNTSEVSVEKTTYALPRPFMVIATQNPVDTHGTFPLPQNQLDRFLLRLHMGYPDAEHEREILRDNRMAGDYSMIEPVISAEELKSIQQAVNEVRIEDSLIDYVVRLAQASRESRAIEVGISTRAAIALQRSAKAKAYLEGRDFCIPDDIKAMAVATLAHRVRPVEGFQNEAEEVGRGTQLIQDLLDRVEVPF